MNETLINTLQSLSNANGHAGNEIEVRRAIKPLIQDHVDELRIDAMGNLITLKRGSGASSLRVMITAHMDEVGLMVTGYTGDGALRVKSVGYINDRLLPGLHVNVGKDKLPGVIGLKAIHRVKNRTANAAAISELAVDIGAANEKEAKRLAPLGSMIAFNTQCRNLGATLIGKAFDDRAGCAILVTLLQGPPLPFDLYGVFTVQEEVGLRGARVAGYTIEPDVAFALEGTLADDLPKKEKDVSSTTEIGKGPAITVMDRSYITPPRLLRHVVSTAQAHNIPCQLKQPGISGTESGSVHFAKGGVPAITIAVPCRYIHSPISLLRHSDLENTFALVQAALANLLPASLTLV